MESRDVTRMQQILATRTASASLEELVDRSQDGDGEVEDHLSELCERGFVVGEDGVYEVTEKGVEWLREHNLYDQIGILYDAYTAACDPPSE